MDSAVSSSSLSISELFAKYLTHLTSVLTTIYLKAVKTIKIKEPEEDADKWAQWDGGKYMRLRTASRLLTNSFEGGGWFICSIIREMMNLSPIVGVGVKKKDISNIKIGNKQLRTHITTLSLLLTVLDVLISKCSKWSPWKSRLGSIDLYLSVSLVNGKKGAGFNFEWTSWSLNDLKKHFTNTAKASFAASLQLPTLLVFLQRGRPQSRHSLTFGWFPGTSLPPLVCLPVGAEGLLKCSMASAAYCWCCLISGVPYLLACRAAADAPTHWEAARFRQLLVTAPSSLSQSRRTSLSIVRIWTGLAGSWCRNHFRFIALAVCQGNNIHKYENGKNCEAITSDYIEKQHKLMKDEMI